MTLNEHQAGKLHLIIAEKLGFLYRLRRRMDQVGFVPNDKLRQLVEKAYDAVFALSQEIHALSCPSGTGRKSNDDECPP